MLSFTLFRFSVRLHWSFAIVLLFVLDSDLPLLAIGGWVVVVFVSILIHELGHAFMARRAGAVVDTITLYAMGGLTAWRSGYQRISSAQRVAVSAAGSGIQVLCGLSVYGLVEFGVFGRYADALMRSPVQVDFWSAGFREDYLAFAACAFVWVSVFWGLLNLVPIAGLDGSHILRESMIKVDPQSGVMHAKIIGLIFAVLVSVVLYQQGFRLAPFIFLWFAVRDFTGQSAGV